MWTYSQGTGTITDHNGKVVATGYSGYLQGKNNPSAQNIRNLGPIPQGKWSMIQVINSPHTGPFTIVLEPVPGTETFGRSAFRIHGDNKTHDASHGCIIIARNIREKIWASGDRELIVI